jgi:RNA polymerase sigma factor (sigma-70 family)
MGMMRMRFNEEMDKYAHRLPANRMFFSSDRTNLDRIRPAIHGIMNDQLTDKQKFCVEMYYFRNCNSSEIAKLLGTSRSNVTKHIRRGLNKMEKSMRYLFLINNED